MRVPRSGGQIRQSRSEGCARLSPCGFPAGSCDTSRVWASMAWRYLLFRGSLGWRWFGRGHGRVGWGWRSFFFLTNPAFHSNLAVNGIRFSEAIIDRCPQSMEWYLAFAIPFRAGNLRTIQPAGAAQANSLGAKIHRDLDRFFHRATIGDATFDLQGNVFSHELRVELRGFDLLNVDFDLFALGHPRNLFRHLLDLGPFAPDHDTGARRVNGHANAVPGALDDDLRDRRKLQLLL